eukprot:6358974-Amphidinium_carterae.1
MSPCFWFSVQYVSLEFTLVAFSPVGQFCTWMCMMQQCLFTRSAAIEGYIQCRLPNHSWVLYCHWLRSESHILAMTDHGVM